MRRKRDRRARSDENIHIEGEKFVDKRSNALRVSVGVALFEQQVSPNNVSQICEAPT
jgi:hypothetical protein